MKTILLKFAGPMQSWGTDSHFEIRHTDSYPSKSGVLGLVAAALGWRRNDKRIEELNKICFAVRVDQPGTILEDYHIAHKPEVKKGGVVSYRTYVIKRHYLQDGVFVAALGISQAEDVDEILAALRQPYFQPYMGRRSLPLPVDFILDVVEGEPVSVLCDFPWQAADWYQQKEQLKDNAGRQRLSIFAEKDIDGGIGRRRRDHVVSLASSGRRYLPRMEYETFCEIAMPKSRQEHDAFAALGGI